MDDRQDGPSYLSVFWCPRRMDRDDGTPLDYWSFTRWASSSWVVWPEAMPKPRTCSYCGGVNPTDALALLVMGWTFGETTKDYKFYMYPPSGPEAVPPVKVYLMHWTKEEASRADAIVMSRGFDAEARKHVQ